MNREAERHLEKAEGYIAKGEVFYRKAATEIVAAKEADFSLTNKVIGERFGRSGSWVSELVTWITSDQPDGTGPKWSRGTHATKAEIEAGAKKLLAQAPLEQIERIITELPPERQQAVAAAAGDRYAKARQRFDEEQNRPLTPAQQKQREAERASVQQHVAQVAAPIQGLTIVSNLEEATEVLHSMVEEQGVNPAVLGPIEKALNAFVTEFQVARAMVGLDSYERSDVA